MGSGTFQLAYSDIDSAIAQFEGANSQGTIAQRQNNPGNLIYNSYTQSLGAVAPGTNGIAIFPDSQTGESALDTLVGNYANQGFSLNDMISAWAPATAPGNSAASTANYQNFVAQQTGLDPTVPINQQVAGSTAGSQNTPQTGASNAWYCGIAQLFGPLGIASNLAGNCGNTPNTGSGVAFAGFSWQRVATFLLGLILIAAGLFMFRPANQIIVGGIRKGAKGAVGAALTL